MLKKSILKSFILILIISLILGILSPIFVLKTDHKRKLYQGLYKDTKAPFDVVLLGSSHMQGGINPNVLWGRYGITSFNYATGGQPINVTYYLLKEVLKKHENPIVVIDLFYLGYNETYGKSGYIRYVLDSMKASSNKVEAVINCTPKSHWITYVFPYLRFHDRWKELNMEDFYYDYEKDYYKKGFDASIDMYGKDIKNNPVITGKAALPPESKKYLMKIIQLSKQQGFKLVFINVPYDASITDVKPSWYKDSQKMFNTIADLAKDNSIPFIEYNKKFDELSFDFKTDMHNADHMNVQGAEKVSTHLGNWLKENYKLTDHRNDKEYAQWNNDYLYYSQKEALSKLKTTRNVEDYISLLQNKNYTLIAICDNYNSLSADYDLRKSLRRLGLKLDERNKENNYMAVINGGLVECEISSPSLINKKITLSNNLILDATTSTNDKNMPGLVFNKKYYSNKYHGFNLVVYDNVLENVIDSVYFEDNCKITR